MKKFWFPIPLWLDGLRSLKISTKIPFIFVILIMLHLSTKLQSQNKMVTLQRENISLEEVIQSLKSQTDYGFFYNTDNDDIKKLTNISVSVANETIEDVLSQVVKGTNITFSIVNDVVILNSQDSTTLTNNSSFDNRIIVGSVMDINKEPLPGVTVVLENTTIGVTTNSEGVFTIRVPVMKGKLIFSFVGFKTKEVEFSIPSEKLFVLMEEEIEEIGDVVVTGIFGKNKESYTGAVTVISEQELKSAGNKNLLISIANIDPSFNMITNNEYGSDPNYLPDIQIRGTANIPTLENLQDASTSKLNVPLIILDGFEITLQRMIDLNSDEVSSITLLKDGSATAIYGSRGANGVVVITTKDPEPGKLRLTYNGSLNIEVPDLSDYNLLNASDKLELERLSGYYESLNVNKDLVLKEKYSQRLADIKRGVDTYWLSKPLRTGVGHRHSLRLEGGDTSFRYAASLQYNEVIGVMKKSDRNSLNAGINLSYKHEKLLFRNDLTLGITKSKNSPYGSFSDYARLNPYWKPYDDDGQLIKVFDDDIEFYGGYSKLPKNPLYNATLNLKQEQQYTDIINHFSIEWKPLDDFVVRGKAGVSVQFSESDNYKPAKHTDFESDEYKTDDGVFRKGRYAYSNGKNYKYEFSLTLNYSKIFAQKHWLYTGLNVDLTSNKNRDYSFIVEGFVDEDLDFLSSALQYQKNGKPSGFESLTRRIGIVGNLNYYYDSRYYLDLSYRTDGASQFGKDKKFAPFFSVGLGWNVHKERFMENVSFIDRLKVRGSFGQTGSQNFSAYQAKALYTYYFNDRYFQWLGSYQKALANNKLEWQKTNKWNVGIEMNCFDDRFNFTADFYLEKTSNLLSSLELPYSNGFTSYVENIGKKENRGFELKATGFLVRDLDQRIVWSVTGALVHDRDKIVKISDAMKKMYDNLLQTGGTLPNKILREGDSENTIYAVKSLGIDPSNGRELFLKKNGDVSYIWNSNDRIKCGVSEPKYRGNFGTMFRYKNLSLNLSFAYRFGGQLYNSTLVSKVENADKKYNVDERVFKNRWQTIGEKSFFKNLLNESTTNPTSRFVQNERTLTCQNIHISHIWQANAWLQRSLGIQSLTLSGDFSDVFYISSVKQERGLSYPFSRRFSFSLSMNF